MKRIFDRRRLLPALAVIAVVAIVLLPAGSASACPSCKVALANQEGKGDLVTGMFYSIMFMLSMPFAILGSFSGYFYMLVRRARRQQESQRDGAEAADGNVER
jgi:hypothetical protein